MTMQQILLRPTETAAGAFGVTVTPPWLQGAVANGTEQIDLLASPINGVGPYTYVWSVVGDGSPTFTANNTAATTVSITGNNVNRSGTITVTATDTSDGEVDTFDVPYDLDFGIPP